MKLLIGGSPCTHWSIAQKKDRETEPQGLGWELFKNYLIALDKYKPDFFLYENNKSMSAAIREQITRELGVEPICINSALVSAQNRQRLYWTNIPGVEQPEDRGILLRDILEMATLEKGYTLKTPGKPLTEREMEYMVRETRDGRNHFDFDHHHDATKPKSSCVTGNTCKGVPYNVIVEPVRIGTIENDAKNQDHDSQQYRVYSPDGKSVTLCGNGGGLGAKTGLYATPVRVGDMPNEQGEINGGQRGRIYSVDGKAPCLCSRPNGGGPETGYCAIPMEVRAPDGKTFPIYEVRDGIITIKGKQYPIKLADGFYIIRKLTVTECMRLQTVPEEYIFPVSPSQAYKMLGNGWTVDVIAHILQHAPGITEEPVEVLSMYDGMSCGHLALDKLGAAITRYYATEIDKYAIQTTQHNYPDTVQLGDAFQVRNDDWSLPELAVEGQTTTASKGGNTMQIKKTVYEETTWERVKALATGGEATEALPLHAEITMNLEDGETVTVEVAAHLPATEDKPAGVRFVFKDCLAEPSSMNDDWTNAGGYKASKARRHVLEDIFPKLPADLRAMIRPRKITEITRDGTLVYEDPLWLPSETDLFGRGDESWQNGAADGPDDFQLPIFQTERDRVKQRPGYGTTPYWLRSVYAGDSASFCLVGADGSANHNYAHYSYGVAPGFDL